MVLARVMMLLRVMVLADVMVLANVMVLVNVMVFFNVMVLAHVMMLPRVMVSTPDDNGGPGVWVGSLEVGAQRAPRLLVLNKCVHYECQHHHHREYSPFLLALW